MPVQSEPQLISIKQTALSYTISSVQLPLGILTFSHMHIKYLQRFFFFNSELHQGCKSKSYLRLYRYRLLGAFRSLVIGHYTASDRLASISSRCSHLSLLLMH